MDIVIIDAILLGHPDKTNTWMLGLEITHEDGTTTRRACRLPEDIFETRAAELDLDPADRDTLLELILYEPFTAPATFTDAIDRDRALATMRAVKKNGKVKTRNRKDHENPVTTPRGRQVVLIDAKHDPMMPADVVKREMLFDPAIIAAKRRITVDHARRARGIAPPAAPPAAVVDYRARRGAAQRLDRHFRRAAPAPQPALPPA